MIIKPNNSEIPEYYQDYIKLIGEEGLLKEFSKSKAITNELFSSITDGNYRYKDGKWTIKEVLKHIIDCERIFNYRALRFSRLDDTKLSGFDENAYMANIKISHVPLSEVVKEFCAVRESTLNLYKFMSEDMLDFKAHISDKKMTARCIGFITVGHNLHHCNIVKSIYLKR